MIVNRRDAADSSGQLIDQRQHGNWWLPNGTNRLQRLPNRNGAPAGASNSQVPGTGPAEPGAARRKILAPKGLNDSTHVDHRDRYPAVS
eukprot:s140_g9.t1